MFKFLDNDIPNYIVHIWVMYDVDDVDKYFPIPNKQRNHPPSPYFSAF